jgi:hypothetical protein
MCVRDIEVTGTCISIRKKILCWFHFKKMVWFFSKHILSDQHIFSVIINNFNQYLSEF